MPAQKLQIYLGDLTHDTVGLATEVFPLNIGYVAAYCLKRFGSVVEIRLFKYIGELERAIISAPPDVLGLSNYPWCHNIDLALFDLLAERRPEALRFMGGPNFPHDNPSQELFLRSRPTLDAYVYLEGEIGFANLIGLLLETGDLNETRRRLRAEPVPGCRQVDAGGGLLAAAPAIRIGELDEIPSPYINGLLDPFFDGRLSPMLSTNRGCPFRCTFCHDGNSQVSKVNSFSTERVVAEIDYIAARVPKSTHSLFVSDLNFGMYKRDIEICNTIADAQTRHGFPNYIDTTTGKNSKQRVIAAVERLNGALSLSMSVQSLTDDVLENIKRDNIRISDFMALKPAIKRAKLPTQAEVILGLPGETLDTHLKTLGHLLDAQIDSVTPYTLMLINGAEMSTPQERAKWGFKSKYRILPRDFTALASGRKVIEVEEVAVETNTLPFSDYLTARKVALLVRWYTGPGLRALTRFIAQEGMPVIDLLKRILAALEGGPGEDAPAPLVDLLRHFEADTRGELWDSAEDLVVHYQSDEAFQRLVSGFDGKNLIQSYESAAYATAMEDMITCAFFHAREMLDEAHASDTTLGQLNQIESYVRGCTFNVLGADRLETVPEAWLEYDIGVWLSDIEERPLTNFELDLPRRAAFAISDQQFRHVEDVLNLFGRSPAGLAKTVVRLNPPQLWRQMQFVADRTP